MHVFVTGASGFIGSAVTAELLEAGHRVTGLARSDAGADRVTSAGAAVVRGELTNVAGVAAAAAGADAVIHLAYRHGAATADAVSDDARVIAAIGAQLAGSDRPFVVTSGTMVLPVGRVGTERDPADPAAPAGARGANEAIALSLADRGVRVAVVRLAPCVHDRVRRGFAGRLVDVASSTGVSGYLGDGTQRWPAVHRHDAARLFRLAMELAPAGSVLHGVGESGVELRAMAEVIAQRLGVATESLSAEEAEGQFGWLGSLVGVDAPASSETTRRLLGWEPMHPGLLEDLDSSEFFDGVQR